MSEDAIVSLLRELASLSGSQDQILDAAARAIRTTTRSPLSVVCKVSEGGDRIEIGSFSTDETAGLVPESGITSLPIAEAAPAGDCIRTKQPQILRNFRGAVPFFRAKEPGSAALPEVLCVPLPDNGKVAVLALAARRDGAYTSADADQVRALLQVSWSTLTCRRLAQQLLEAQDHYNFLMDNMYEGFWLAEIEPMKALYLSPALSTILGRSLESLYTTTQTWMDAIHPDDLREFAETVEEHKKGIPTDIVIRVIHPGGAIRHVRNRVFPIKDETGRYVRVSGIFEDITEKWLAEAALDRSEKRFRALIERGGEGILVLHTDGTFLYLGPMVERISGFDPVERLGKNAFESVHPQDMPLARAVFERICATPGAEERILFRLIKKDGSIFWADAIAVNLAQDPNVGGIVVNYHDVTELKRIEEELRKKEEQIRDLQNRLPDTTIYEMVLTPDGRRYFSFVSAGFERMFEMHPGAFTQDASLLARRLHPDDAEAALAEQARCAKALIVFKYECRFILPSGRVRRIRWHSVPRLEPDGSIISTGVAIDVTQYPEPESN